MTDASRREQLFWVLLLSVPPGVAVGGFASVGLAGGTVTPLAAGMGVATTLSIAGLVTLLLMTGSTDIEPRSE